MIGGMFMTTTMAWSRARTNMTTRETGKAKTENKSRVMLV
jgi:hypothetical protein